MKACAVIITPAAGTGVQTFSGFNDKNGAPFVPKVFMPIGIGPKDSVAQYWSWAYGFDDGITHVGENCDEGPAVGLKDVAAGTSGDYSILKYLDQLSFGGRFLTWAKITAIRSGQIDVQFDLNDSPGDSYIMVALGGDELDYAIINTNGTGVISPGFEPVAVINRLNRSFSGTSTGGGSLGNNIGFATKSDGHTGSASAVVCAGDISSGDNAIYQDITNAWSLVGGTFLAPVNTFGRVSKAVSSWNSTSFTLTGDSQPTGTLALGGIQATSGSWTEPASDGNLDIDTTIDRKIVIFVSTGQTSFGSINNGAAQFVIGVYDCVNNVSVWTGESYVGDTGASLLGARSLSSSKVIQFATANGDSTTFANKATASLLSGTKVRLAFTNTDGTQRKGIWLALGDLFVPASPGAGIYKIVPGKKNDTVYTSQSPITTEDMDIPNPFAEGGLVGDE